MMKKIEGSSVLSGKKQSHSMLTAAIEDFFKPSSGKPTMRICLIEPAREGQGATSSHNFISKSSVKKNTFIFDKNGQKKQFQI